MSPNTQRRRRRMICLTVWSSRSMFLWLVIDICTALLFLCLVRLTMCCIVLLFIHRWSAKPWCYQMHFFFFFRQMLKIVWSPAHLLDSYSITAAHCCKHCCPLEEALVMSSLLHYHTTTSSAPHYPPLLLSALPSLFISSLVCLLIPKTNGGSWLLWRDTSPTTASDRRTRDGSRAHLCSPATHSAYFGGGRATARTTDTSAAAAATSILLFITDQRGHGRGQHCPERAMEGQREQCHLR